MSRCGGSSSFWIATVSLVSGCTGSTSGGATPSTADAGAGVDEGGAASTTTAQSFAGDRPAPEFPAGLDWLNVDAPLTLAALRGKVVLLDFWTYGCINCIHILPELERLEAEFAEELVVIGVHSAKFANEGDTENIRQVVLRYGIEHPVVNDAGFQVWDAWATSAWPTTVLIDPAGNVVGGHSGEGVYDVAQPVIASLVAEFDARGELDRGPVADRPRGGRHSRTGRSPSPARCSPSPAATGCSSPTPGATGSWSPTAHRRGHRRLRLGSTPGSTTGRPPRRPSTRRRDGARRRRPHPLRRRHRQPRHARRRHRTGQVTTCSAPASGATRRSRGPAPTSPSPRRGTSSSTATRLRCDGRHPSDLVARPGVDPAAAPLVGSSAEGVRNGPLAEAELAQPSGLALIGDTLYFADAESSSIRSADIGRAGATALVAGASASLFEFGAIDGVGDEARFQHPVGVAAVDDDTLLVADTYNSLIRRVDPGDRAGHHLSGDEAGWRDGDEPRFNEPGGISVDGDTAYVADTNNHAIRVIDLATGSTSTLLLEGIEAFEPPPGSDGYRGTVIPVGPATVAPGNGTLLLDVRLPAGYAVNGDAPSSLVLAPDGPATILGGGGGTTFDLTGKRLPVGIPVRFTAPGDLVADLTLVYCEKETPELCLIEMVRFEVPVALGGGNAVSEAVLTHRVVLPDLGGSGTG